MRSEQVNLRALTPNERRLAVAIGVVLLVVSLLSLTVTVALFLPFARLVEGLSK